MIKLIKGIIFLIGKNKMDIVNNKGFGFCLHLIMKRGDYLGFWLIKHIFSHKAHTFGVLFIKQIAYDNEICYTKYLNSREKIKHL